MFSNSVHQIGSALARRKAEQRRERQRAACPFEVGDGVTYSIGSDRYPGTVREVSPSGHRVEVTLDRVRGGTVFVLVDDAKRMVFTRRRNGRYITCKSKCGSISKGRSHHMDPHF